MSEFVQSYVHLLTHLLAEPEQSVFSQPVLSEAQQHEQLLGSLQCDVSLESVWSPNVLVQFEQVATQQPDRPCVAFEGEQMSYAAVNAAASALARRLAAAGVSRGSSVGVLLPRSFELVVSVLATWKAGGVYVPLDPEFPDDRLAIYAEVSGDVNSFWMPLCCCRTGTLAFVICGRGRCYCCCCFLLLLLLFAGQAIDAVTINPE